MQFNRDTKWRLLAIVYSNRIGKDSRMLWSYASVKNGARVNHTASVQDAVRNDASSTPFISDVLYFYCNESSFGNIQLESWFRLVYRSASGSWMLLDCRHGKGQRKKIAHRNYLVYLFTCFRHCLLLSQLHRKRWGASYRGIKNSGIIAMDP